MECPAKAMMTKKRMKKTKTTLKKCPPYLILTIHPSKLQGTMRWKMRGLKSSKEGNRTTGS